MFPKVTHQAPPAPAAPSEWSQSSPLSSPRGTDAGHAPIRKSTTPCVPRFPIQPSTLLQADSTLCFSSQHSKLADITAVAPQPSGSLARALSLRALPRPIPWSLYAGLSHHPMSPRTRLTWPLLGPPPWCTSPPLSGLGPASWGLCYTRGGCGPEGSKGQAVSLPRPTRASLESASQEISPRGEPRYPLAWEDISTNNPTPKAPSNQGSHIRNTSPPLPAKEPCPAPPPSKQVAHSQRATLPLPVAR